MSESAGINTTFSFLTWIHELDSDCLHENENGGQNRQGVLAVAGAYQMASFAFAITDAKSCELPGGCRSSASLGWKRTYEFHGMKCWELQRMLLVTCWIGNEKRCLATGRRCGTADQR